MPVSKHDAVGQGATRRQIASWSVNPRVTVTTRPLRYYRRGTDASGRAQFEAREKGIDVLLALAMVLGAERDEYDVAVLFSADTDLLPAIDGVRSIGKRCEVAGWKPPSGYGNALRVAGLWCHWLDPAPPRSRRRAAPHRYRLANAHADAKQAEIDARHDDPWE